MLTRNKVTCNIGYSGHTNLSQNAWDRAHAVSSCVEFKFNQNWALRVEH